jgi:hypothetical protein
MAPPKKQFLHRARDQQKKAARARDALRKVVRRKRAYEMDDFLNGIRNGLRDAPENIRRHINNNVIRSQFEDARGYQEENMPNDAYRQGKKLKRLDQHMRGELKPVYFT